MGTQRMLQDKRILSEDFVSVSADIRKACAYLNLKAEKNVSDKHGGKKVDPFEEEVMDEKFELAGEAYDAIDRVIASLEKEKELRAVTIVGIEMTPELVGA